MELVADTLSKRFRRRVLFRELSFRVEPGVPLAVTGANGSGKSTLIKILAGVLRPTKGHAHLSLNGTLLSAAERPLHTGLVAPYFQVYDGLSPRENLAFIAKARRLADAESRIDDTLRHVQLHRRSRDLVKTFSSGMKQRMRFAAALLAAPPLLLLDEPTSNLDAAGREMVHRFIVQQRDEGRLLVIATNDPADTALCTARIHVEDYR
ncbi:MAG: ATP-binding cassette domain-containing protein [Bacteroidota bacterium]